MHEHYKLKEITRLINDALRKSTPRNASLLIHSSGIVLTYISNMHATIICAFCPLWAARLETTVNFALHEL